MPVVYGAATTQSDPKQHLVQPPSCQLNHKEMQRLFNNPMANCSLGQGEEVILVLGATGSGKSTTVNYVLGHPIMSCKKEQVEKEQSKDLDALCSNLMSKMAGKEEYVLDVDENAQVSDHPIAPIGHNSLSSCTTWPTCYSNVASEITLCDCPGFFDSKSIEQQCAIAISIKKIIMQSARVKALLFVVDKPSLEAGRGKVFRKVVTALQNMLVNPIDHIGSIFFAFTKAKDWQVGDFGQVIWEYCQALQKRGKAAADNEMAQDLLKAILQRREEALLIVHPTNKDERVDLIAKLSRAQGIEKVHFRSIGGAALDHHLKRYCSEIAVAGDKLLQALTDVEEELANSLSMVEGLQEQINEDIRVLESVNNSDNLSTLYTQSYKMILEDIKRLGNKLNNKEDEQKEIYRQIIDWEKQQAQWNSQEVEVISFSLDDQEMEKYTTNSCCPWKKSYRGKLDASIGYPYFRARCEKADPAGIVSTISQYPQKGIYEIRYESKRKAGLCVKVYVQKRERYQPLLRSLDRKIARKTQALQEIKIAIEKLNNKIASLETQQKVYEQLTLSSQKNRMKLQNAIAVDRSLREREKEKLIPLRAKRSSIKKQLESKKGSFDWFMANYQLLGF